MPVPLLFKNATQQKLVVVNNTSNDQLFIESLGFIPDTVLIDPELWLISANNTSEKITFAPGEPAVTVFPNPVADILTVTLIDMTDPSAAIVLYNSAGQLVLRTYVSLINGSEIVRLNMQALARGFYHLVITSGDFKFTKQLIR
jgi:hypothetical protein